MAKTPPDILITTPESLYLMLSSNVRGILATTEAVIVDEIHAVAQSKRGAHLALTLERLDALVQGSAREESGEDSAEQQPGGSSEPSPDSSSSAAGTETAKGSGGRGMGGSGGGGIQRIGLSATQRPLERIAKFLVGPKRECKIVDAGRVKKLDLEIVVPVEDMSDPGAPAYPSENGNPPSEVEPAAHVRSIWPAIYPKLLELVQDHTSTIIFVNNRRASERLAKRLNELANGEGEQELPATEHAGHGAEGEVSTEPPAVRDGETSPSAPPAYVEIARAHHGSLSHEERTLVEEMLKSGELPCLVATSSLELGIDMGAVDLVIQVESPKSVTRGLQRIGRAGHGLGEVSKGRIFPKYRGDLLECAVVARRMREGEIEETVIPQNPLDVLAQHLVSMAAMDEWEVDAVERLVTATESFHDLSREQLENVLDMLDGRYPSDRFADLRPRIVWDRTGGTIHGRKGVALAGRHQRRHDPRPRPLQRQPAGRPPGRRARRGDGLRGPPRPDLPARRHHLADRGNHPRPGDRHPGPRRPRRRPLLEGRRDRPPGRAGPGDRRLLPRGGLARAGRAGRRVRPRPARRQQPRHLPARAAAGDPRRPLRRDDRGRALPRRDRRLAALHPLALRRPRPLRLGPGPRRQDPRRARPRGRRDLVRRRHRHPPPRRRRAAARRPRPDRPRRDRGPDRRRALRLGPVRRPLPRERRPLAADPARLPRQAHAALAAAAEVAEPARGGAGLPPLPGHPRDLPRVPAGRARPAGAGRPPAQAARAPDQPGRGRDPDRLALRLLAAVRLRRHPHVRGGHAERRAAGGGAGARPRPPARAAGPGGAARTDRPRGAGRSRGAAAAPHRGRPRRRPRRPAAAAAQPRRPDRGGVRRTGDRGLLGRLDAGEAGRRAPRRQGPDRRRGALHRRRGRRPLPRRARGAAAGRPAGDLPRGPPGRDARPGPPLGPHPRPLPDRAPGRALRRRPLAGPARARERRGDGPRRAAAGGDRARVVRLRSPAPGPPRQPRPPAQGGRGRRPDPARPLPAELAERRRLPPRRRRPRPPARGAGAAAGRRPHPESLGGGRAAAPARRLLALLARRALHQRRAGLGRRRRPRPLRRPRRPLLPRGRPPRRAAAGQRQAGGASRRGPRGDPRAPRRRPLVLARPARRPRPPGRGAAQRALGPGLDRRRHQRRLRAAAGAAPARGQLARAPRPPLRPPPLRSPAPPSRAAGR